MDFPERDKPPRGEAPRKRSGEREKRDGKHGGAKCYRASTFDRFVVSQRWFPSASSPSFFPAAARSARAKIELRCHRYPPESRSIWKRGKTRRRPRNRRLSSCRNHLRASPPRFPFALRDKALFQDFRALCTGPTSRIVC